MHFLRLHVVGKRITSASAIDDKNVFGKVGTTGAEVEAALKGKKVNGPELASGTMTLPNPFRLCRQEVRANTSGKLPDGFVWRL